MSTFLDFLASTTPLALQRVVYLLSVIAAANILQQAYLARREARRYGSVDVSTRALYIQGPLVAGLLVACVVVNVLYPTWQTYFITGAGWALSLPFRYALRNRLVDGYWPENFD